MPLFVQVVAGITGFLIAALLLDSLRRRGFPRLPKAQVSRLNLKSSPSVPDEFYLRVAKTVIEGKLDRAPLGKKPFVDFFPRKSACPHCGGKQRNPWDLGRMGRLLADTAALARQIKQGRYCLGCLELLSNIAAAEKEHLVELKTGDPQSLSPLVPRRVVIPLFLGALVFPPLLIPATFIIAVKKRGVYWLLFLLTASFCLCLVISTLAIFGFA